MPLALAWLGIGFRSLLFVIVNAVIWPVAVNLQCWAARRARARVFPDGRVEVGF